MMKARCLTAICFGTLTLTGCGGSDDSPRPIVIVADPTVSFVGSAISVNESESTEIRVELSRKTSVDVTVPFTVSGSATNADYTLSASSFVIPAGESFATIGLIPVNDTIDEPNESVVITMGTPVNARVGANTTATVTIIDDDQAPGAIVGRATDVATGAALATVAVNGGGLSATTSQTGAYELSPAATSGRIINNFSLAGYAPQSRTTPAFSNDYAQVLANIPMVSVALVDTYDASLPKTITVPGTNAALLMSAGSLRTVAGATPAGNVTARVTPIAPASNLGVLPGNYVVVSAGASVPFETFGALDARFVDSTGNLLDLAANATLTLNIPVSTRSSLALPTTTTLYYFDTAAGIWRIDGTATLQGAAPNQTYQATTTHASTAYTAGQIYSTVNVTSCVESATGARIADASITAEGTTYTGLTTAVTDSNGSFTVPMKINSTGFLQASKGTSISNSPQVSTLTSSITLSTCLVLTPSTLSVKLTWGAAPADLDSHVLGANSTDHIYYASKGSLTQLPFVALDVDDVTGNGPEVTTFASLAQNRTYRFYVHNFSNTFSPGQTGSPARVEVTNNGIQTVFNPPTGETSQTRYWHVFDMTTDGNCVPTIVPVQQFTIAEPVNANVGNAATFCVN